MKKLKLAVIAGDGVGHEVIPAAKEVLEAAGRKFGISYAFTDFDWGTSYYLKTGRMMPEDGLEQLRQHHAILLGAVGHPGVPDHVTLNGLLLPIRRGFDQFANVRPAILFPGVESPLRDRIGGDIDMVVVRENTEGEYAQVGGFVHQNHSEEVAIQTSVFTRMGIERIIRYAFSLAVRRNKKQKVCSITKSNAQGFSMVLWDKIFMQVAADYPTVQTESLLVDAAASLAKRRAAGVIP